LATAVPRFYGKIFVRKGQDEVVQNNQHTFTTNLVDDGPVDPYEKTYIQIQNITAGMTKPCLLDLKLASKPYNEKKIAR
jgi:hypothetical protein